MQPNKASYPALSSVTLARMETRWHKPWLIGALSHWGQGHESEGIPNQDAFALGHVGEVTWIAVADGVSSAPMGGAGALFVVNEVGHHIQRRLMKSQAFKASDMTVAVDTTRQKLVDEAAYAKQSLGHYATTLLVAVLSGNALTVAKIGDGYVLGVERSRDRARLVSLAEAAQPRHGSQVTPITDAKWHKALMIRHIADRHAAGIDTVALATDGCDRFFAKIAAKSDREPTVELNPDLIDTHLTQSLEKLGARNLFVYLANLMGHPQFVDEGDDRTLVVATARLSEQAHDAL
jgi:hypothetical protein